MAERAGSGNALLHLLTAEVFDAAEALRLDSVQKVAPAGTTRPCVSPTPSPRKRRWPWWPRSRTCARQGT
jgi:enoyl-CoA hydratase/carnithine racemase